MISAFNCNSLTRPRCPNQKKGKMRHLAVVVLVALLALQGNAQTNSSCSTDAYTCSLDSDCLFGVCVGSQCITTEGGTLGHVCAATGTDGLTEGTCRDGLYCDSSSQLCTTLLTNGTACTQSGSCEHGLACSTICRTVLLPGDACVFGAETQVCVNSGGAIGGHECNSTTLVCEGTDHNTTTQGEAGDECCPDAGGLGCASNVGHGCDVGLYCNGGIMSSGICVAKVAANGACDPQLQDDACDAGLVCGFNSNVCEPHHGVELGHVCTADTDCQFFPGGAVQCKSSVCTAVTSADTCSQAAPTCGEYSYCTCSTNLTESAPTCVLQFAPDLSQDANGTWTDLQACMVTNACHAGHYLMHDPVYMLSSSTNCKLCTSEFIAHECAMNRDISWRGATGLSGVTVARPAISGSFLASRLVLASQYLVSWVLVRQWG